MRLPCSRHPQSCVIHNPQDHTNKVAQRAQYSSLGIPRIFELLQHRIRPSKATNGPPSGLSSLPIEILLIICEYLPLSSQASLAFTCTLLKQRLGPKFWPQLKSEAKSKEKINFLKLLQKDVPKFYLCSQCHLLHARPTRSLRPGWHGSYKLEPFYHLTRSQIRAALDGSICTEYLTCAGLRTVNLGEAASTVGVWCRPRIVNGRFLLNRHYVFPLPPFTARNPSCPPPSPMAAIGLKLCTHVTLTSLTIPNFPPLSGSYLGFGCSGYIEQVDRWAGGPGYRICRRCQICYSEFYLLMGDGMGAATCDFYNVVMDRRHQDVRGGRKPYWLVRRWWNGSQNYELSLFEYRRETIREMYENAAGSRDVKPLLW